MTDYLYLIPAIILSLSFHEMAHALVSYWFGDPTPKLEGRLTLNPMKHIDWMGVACLLIFRFGWAKPVPVSTRYYKEPKTGMVWTAFAGPMANFILAFLAIGVGTILMHIHFNNITYIIWQLCITTASISTGLGVFNLIPIPPLDGSKVFFSFLPDEQYFHIISYNSPAMMAILIALLYTGIATGPLRFAQTQILNIFFGFWQLFF